MAQKKHSTAGIVYSTDSNFRFDTNESSEIPTSPAEQRLYVKLDKKQRAGKMVTLVEGYRGSEIDELGKSLKKSCGTGGSVKDGIIIVQGDNRDKIIAWLLKNGYKDVKKA